MDTGLRRYDVFIFTAINFDLYQQIRQTEKTPAGWRVGYSSKRILTFGELSRTTSLAETVVLAFYNAAVACQEASRLQRSA